MALTYKYSKKDEIPPDLAPHYVERDGVFLLDVQGALDAEATNAALAKASAERDSLIKTKERLENRLSTLRIEGGVLSLASTRGLRPTAKPDLLHRARSVMQVRDDELVILAEDGRTIRKGKDGKTAMTPEEWLEQEMAEAPHLFESNTGGGAASNNAGGRIEAPPEENPFAKATWNVSRQMRLMRDNPVKAEELRRSAK